MPVLGAFRRIVIADDEPNLRKVLGSLLRREGYDVLEARDGEEALKLLSAEVSVLITDLRMPRLDGMALFRRALAEYPDLKVIIWTAYGRITESVEAVKHGAFDYIEKGVDNDILLQVVRKAVSSFELDQKSPHRASGPLPTGMGRFGLIGTSSALQQTFQLIDKVADTPSTVLITGESGTGKELVARALHEQSSRKNEAFIKINCAAIPKTLMESELFGYEKGAFTGAVSQKPGRFELADRGTLFLDEIGELPLEMQVKLLRVLQESEFERVGGIKTLHVDVRMIAATNRDLLKEVAQGNFREELYYRLNVVPIGLPPLREVILLVGVEDMDQDQAAQVLSITPAALRQRLSRARTQLASSLEAGENGRGVSPKSSTIAISDDDATVAVVNQENGSVSFFATATNTRLSTAVTGSVPSSVVIPANGQPIALQSRGPHAASARFASAARPRARSWPQPASTSCPADCRRRASTPRWLSVRMIWPARSSPGRR